MSYGLLAIALPGRKCRVTTGNFKARKGFAVLLALAFVLALAGCGRQDRYEITTPAPRIIAAPIDWGRFTEIPVPASSSIRALAAWSADDYLLALGLDATCRVQDGLHRPLAWPGSYEVRGLHLTADQVMWGLDAGGQLGRLEGDLWVAEEVVPTFGPAFSGLLADDLGRLVAYGSNGLVMRREEGQWVERRVGTGEEFLHGWSAPGQGAFLVSYRGTVFRLTDTGPDTLTVLPDVSSSSIRIGGDGQGALVVCARYDGTWLFDGETWREIGEDFTLIDAFWSDGSLLGLSNQLSQGIVRWDGEAWQPWAAYPIENSSHWALSVPVPQGRLIVQAAGAVMALVGQETAALGPPLGEVAGVARFQGQTHLLLEEGSHFVSEGAGWRVVGQAWTEDTALQGRPLVVDEDGRLLLAARNHLAWWDGQSHTLEPHPGTYWAQAMPQPDGSVCLSGSSDWGMVRHGRYTAFPDLPAAWNTVVGAVLDADGSGWVVDDRRLGRADQGRLTTELLMQGWYPEGVLRDAEGRLVVYGTGRVLRQDQAGWEDITPRLADQANLRALAPDGLGGLLGLDDNNDALLHHDAAGWSFQPWPQLSSSSRRLDIIADVNGAFLVTGFRNKYLLLEKTVWP